MITTFRPFGYSDYLPDLSWESESKFVTRFLGVSMGGRCLDGIPQSPYHNLFGYGAYVVENPGANRVYFSGGNSVASNTDAPSITQLRDLAFNAIHSQLAPPFPSWERPVRVNGEGGPLENGNCLWVQGYPWVIRTPLIIPVEIESLGAEVTSPFQSGMIDHNDQMLNPLTAPCLGKWEEYLEPTPFFKAWVSFSPKGQKNGYVEVDILENSNELYPDYISSSSLVASQYGQALNGYIHQVSDRAEWFKLAPRIKWEDISDQPDVLEVYFGADGELDVSADSVQTKAAKFFISNEILDDIIAVTIVNLRQSQFNAAIFAATGKTTIKMVAEPLGRLIEATTLLRERKFSALVRRFKRWFGVDRSVTDFAKEAASRNLAWQFGWKQLYDDVTECIKAFNDEIRPILKDQIVFTGARKDYKVPVVYLGEVMEIDVTVKTRIDLRAIRDIDIFDEMSGFTNPSDLAATLYDFVPYSFVMDWFIPLTRLFRVVSLLDRYQFVSGSISVRVQNSYELPLSPNDDPEETVAGHLSLDCYHRFPLEQADLMPRINVIPEVSNLGPWHAVTALSLLAQQVF